MLSETNLLRALTFALAGATVASGCRISPNSDEDRELAWTLTPELRLGSQSGRDALYRVSARSTTVGSDGSFYVLDKGNYRVITFDAEGDYVREFGSRGEGRSEFAYPMALLGPREDTLSILDGPSLSHKLFTTAGDFLEARRIPQSAASEDQRDTSDGIVLVEIFGYRSGSEDVTDRLVLIRDRGDTISLVSHTRAASGTYRVPVCNYIIPAAEPLFGHVLWWDAAGDLIAATLGPDYSVQVFNRGELAHVLERPVPPVPVTEALAREELGNGSTWSVGGRACTADPEEELRARGFEDFRQVITGIRVDPTGWIWVRRHAAPPGEEDRHRIDVFDSAGAFHGTLPADTPWPGMFTPDGRIVRRELDELDVEYLVVYRIDRN